MANLNYIIEFSFSFCTKCCTYVWENVNLNTEIHRHFTYCIAILHFTLQIEFCYIYASIEEEWRGTESMLLEVQCEVSTVSDDLGCHVICWCWSTVFSEVHSQRSHLPGNFRALPCFLLLTSFMEMLISFSSRTWHLPTLPKVPKADSMTMVLLCLIDQQTRLTWTP